MEKAPKSPGPQLWAEDPWPGLGWAGLGPRGF